VGPLWIVSLFVTLTETVLGFALTQTTGGVQMALTVFVLGFPVLVASAFFKTLWSMAWVFYSPNEYGNTDPERFIGALAQAQMARSEKTAEELSRAMPRPVITPAQTRHDIGLPSGWYAWGSGRNDYEFGVDDRVYHAGKRSGFTRSIRPSEGFGALSQIFKADAYRGKRLKMTAFVRTQDVENAAGLWMRVDGPDGKLLGFDNMSTRPIKGTTGWTKYQIVLDVPESSIDIAFGTLLDGEGEIWCDTFSFEVVDQNTPTTAMDLDYPGQPVNLDFEA
jgi:hypothetical protein